MSHNLTRKKKERKNWLGGGRGKKKNKEKKEKQFEHFLLRPDGESPRGDLFRRERGGGRNNTQKKTELSTKPKL